MRFITLTKGYSAIVDDEDYDWLNKYKWHYFGPGYAARDVMSNGKREKILLHRCLLHAPQDMWTDHINLNKLDNRRSNLRLLTVLESNSNRGKYKNNTSGYKGVVWEKRYNKWVARVNYNKRNYFLGYYTDANEAALAYNRKAIELHGEYAKLNIIK